jgi:HKD family nuclease
MPSKVFFQPFAQNGAHQQFGLALKAEFQQTKAFSYRKLDICVAYTVLSGISQLGPDIRQFVRSGGHARIYIGVGNRVTSAEAVYALLQTGAEIFACITPTLGRNSEDRALFHPKIYCLTGTTRAWLAIGSNNLTASGLYRNFEAAQINELDLTSPIDRQVHQMLDGYLNSFINKLDDLRPIRNHADIQTLVNEQLLELGGRRTRRNAAPAVVRAARPRIGGQGPAIPRIPPPDLEFEGFGRGFNQHPPVVPIAARRRAGAAPPIVGPVPAQSATTARFFAMSLASFDTSHRAGRPGTQEISLPKSCKGFFPAISHAAGNNYEDAYFPVLLNCTLNVATPDTVRVEYRLWERPGRENNHGDLRINVKAITISQTVPDEENIILFERIDNPLPGEHLYEVWIVHTNDPQYAYINGRLNLAVGAGGRAGQKQIGFF